MAPFAGRTLLFVCLYTLLLVGLATCDEATCDADGTCAATTDDALNDEDHSRSYGIQQTTASDEVEQGLAMQQRLLKVDDYMQNTVFVEERYTTVRDECQNREALCVFWASLGECEANPAYMLLHCAPSCFSCDKLIFEERCPIESDYPAAWNPGDLNKMFERITTEPYYQKYAPTILSRPLNDESGSNNPWLVQLDNFLSEKECKQMILLGSEQGYKRSEDVGPKKFDGTYDGTKSEGRTSSNAWCLDSCYANATTRTVLERIENLTGIPDQNSEYLQILRYEETQFYQSHHDFIPHHVNRVQGPRILTVFLYLNDVEEGGGTRFTDLDITVMPKQGRAILWPSVTNNDPLEQELLTHHEAMPVLKGIKYGANAWVHLKDFKTPFKDSCI